MNFNQEQNKLIYNAVRRYQVDKCIRDSKEYHECSDILDSLFLLVYTQKQEQTR